MNNNIIGIITSFIFVFIIIGLSTVLTKYKIIGGEGSRKFIHIGVSNWWILAMVFFDSRYYAAIVPAAFVIINYLSYKYKVIDAMEREGSSKDLGTVYYAVSLFFLAIVTLGNRELSYIGALGILTMGYGDGFAAVVGTFIAKKYYKIGKSEKSIAGTVTMFIVTLVVILLVLSICTSLSIVTILMYSLLLSVIATALELFTPKGLDNMTVPLGLSLIYYLFML